MAISSNVGSSGVVGPGSIAEVGRQATSGLEAVTKWRDSMAVSSRFRGVRLAVGMFGATVLALILMSTAVVLIKPVDPRREVILFSAVAVVYAVCGLAVWLRRPANQLGAILIGGGFIVACTNLSDAPDAPLIAVGQIFATIPLAVIIHLMVAFPSGRLRDRVSQVITAAAYFVTVVMQAPFYLFAGSSPPFNTLQVASLPRLLNPWMWLQVAVWIAVAGATAALCAVRWHALPAPDRRLLGPLYCLGILVVLALPLSVNVVRPAFGVGLITIDEFQAVALALVPIGFAVYILCGGFPQTAEIEELGAWLGADEPDRPSLQAALATALGDPSVELIFANDTNESHRFLDPSGVPVPLPQSGSGRSVSEVEVGGRLVGAVLYDTMTIEDPDLVRAAGRVVALAIDRERLVANLRTSSEALRESRARINDATDAERRRIARDLHDGLQSRLLLLGIEANRAGNPHLQAGIDSALHELREFVHGIMPSRLIEQGLFAAIEDLRDRSPVRMVLTLPDKPVQLAPSAESAAYFVVAEALSNAVKHSGADLFSIGLGHSFGQLRIEISDNGRGGADVTAGTGLRGIADRVEAVGGRLWIDNALPTGTRLITELPCAF